jgi:hypothetical protein
VSKAAEWASTLPPAAQFPPPETTV